MLFLFIHGAWHGSWCWVKVKLNLSKAGHTVLSSDLPGRNNDFASYEKISL